MRSYFFDIDTILTVYNKVWIVDKSNPNMPLLRINQSDFNLIKSGVYKNQGNKINFAGNFYWIPIDLMNEIKIKCKNNKSISQVGIEWAIEQSLQLRSYGVPVLHYYSMGKSENIKQIASSVF